MADSESWGITANYKYRITQVSYYGDIDTSNPIQVISNAEYVTSNSTVRASSMSVLGGSPLLFFAGVYNTGSGRSYTKPADIGTSSWTEDFDGGDTNSALWHEVCSMPACYSLTTGNMDATFSATTTLKGAFTVALNVTPKLALVATAGSARSYQDSLVTMTVAKPTGTLQGDIMFYSTTVRANRAIGAPSGWTKIADWTKVGSYSMLKHSLYYKVAGASEPSSYTWDYDVPESVVGIISTFRGLFVAGLPISTYSNLDYSTDNTTCRAGSVNVDVSAKTVLFFGAFYLASGTDYFTPPANFKELDDQGNSTVHHFLTVARSEGFAIGDTGDIDATFGSTGTIKHAFAVVINNQPNDVSTTVSIIPGTLSIISPVISTTVSIAHSVINLVLQLIAPGIISDTITLNATSYPARMEKTTVVNPVVVLINRFNDKFIKPVTNWIRKY